MGCAQRMREIEAGVRPLDQASYDAHEVAERYGVHVNTVYRCMKGNDPLYPYPQPLGIGPRPRLSASKEQVEACDQRRLVFYKTTPSWLPPLSPQRPAKYVRIKARDLIKRP